MGPETLRASPPAGRRCSGAGGARPPLGSASLRAAAGTGARRGSRSAQAARPRCLGLWPAPAAVCAAPGPPSCRCALGRGGDPGDPAALQRPRLAYRRVRWGWSSRKLRVGLHLGALGPHCRAAGLAPLSGGRASPAPNPFLPQVLGRMQNQKEDRREG